ncbi:MAG: LptF/LptG family permease, partial [Gemmatimonadetes bacterium]|nr:LptF/LptG family permease [Gemmatimonadota bacterium]
MPLLLSRYILLELLRVFALTAVVLVTVIAFGASIKPLAHDHLLSAAQTMKYILLAIVPMAQFALPFAAGFAATLVMHRLTADNEILAASVSGLSYPRILAPVLALAAALALVMVVLTQSIIPRFWGLMKQTIALDVTRLLESSIERGAPLQIGTNQIYADRLMRQADPGDTGADARLHLLGFAWAELDKDGRIRAEVTASHGVVDVYHRGQETVLMPRLQDPVYFDSVTGELAAAPVFEPLHPIRVPAPFEDDPQFMTRGELLRLRANPDAMSDVAAARVRL